jgi:splicing factor 3A subunit 2
LEVIDVAKDPYLMQNHLGQYECRLCLTLHTNEGNYLAHTQGKRHQQNLAKRAAMEARDKPIQPAPKTTVAPRKTVKIGKPGYRVTKLYDPDAQQRHLLFQASFSSPFVSLLAADCGNAGIVQHTDVHLCLVVDICSFQFKCSG